MKKVILLLAIPLLVCCSKSPDEKAKSLIKDNLRKSLHDYASYEAVEFGTLDSVFTSASDLPEFSELKADYDYKKGTMDRLMSSVKFDIEWAQSMGGYTSTSEYRKVQRNLSEVEEMQKELMVIANKLDSINENYMPEFIGYSMIHRYRSKTISGNMKLAISKFIFDKDITEIATIIED